MAFQSTIESLALAKAVFFYFQIEPGGVKPESDDEALLFASPPSRVEAASMFCDFLAKEAKKSIEGNEKPTRLSSLPTLLQKAKAPYRLVLTSQSQPTDDVIVAFEQLKKKEAEILKEYKVVARLALEVKRKHEE